MRPVPEALAGAESRDDRGIEERPLDPAEGGVSERDDGGIAVRGGEINTGRVEIEEPGLGEGLLKSERVVGDGVGWVVVGPAWENFPWED